MKGEEDVGGCCWRIGKWGKEVQGRDGFLRRCHIDGSVVQLGSKTSRCEKTHP